MSGPTHPRLGVIIPAGGSGVRFGEHKQFKQFGKRPLLYYTLSVFLEYDNLDEIVVAVPEDDVPQVKREIASITQHQSVYVVPGGERRQDSVRAGLEKLSPACDLVCIHDAVRPFLTIEMVSGAVEACRNSDGAVIAIPARDTIKQVDPETGKIEKTVPREKLWLAQTPQVFRREPLEKALQNAGQNQITGTDEAALLEIMGYEVCVVPGHPTNLKITTRDDWIIAEKLRNTK